MNSKKTALHGTHNGTQHLYIYIYILKLFTAFFISLCILSLICFFYYNVPVHFTNDNGYTDYVWESNKFYSRGTEGYSFGKTNNEGINCAVDYTSQKVDILFIGSSQFEGFNVRQSEKMSAVLNDKLGDDYFVYNIGTSGHDFLRCTQNFDKALDKYKPAQYIVVEVSDLFLKEADIENALNNNIQELHSSSNKLVVTLEKVPLLRHLYNQLDNALHKGGNNNDSETFIQYNDSINQSLDVLLNKMYESADKYDAEIIFLYHSPNFEENEQISKQKQIWKNACDDNNIVFLDMTDSFKSEFAENKYVYGFLNTLPNSGHLNKNGHRVVAQRIYDYITTGE